MAALDFGMALARGMLPTLKTAQEDLIAQAGGRNIFKSEDWWNKAVDKQIKSGYRQSQTGTVYKTTSGEWAARGTGVVNPTETGLLYGDYKNEMFQPPENALIKGYTSGGGNFWTGWSAPSPIYETREVTYYGSESQKKDYTAGELKDIELSAKAGAKRVKAEVAAKKPRKVRGAGGLVGKAVTAENGAGTGLPALGVTGLGFGSENLGSGLNL